MTVSAGVRSVRFVGPSSPTAPEYELPGKSGLNDCKSGFAESRSPEATSTRTLSRGRQACVQGRTPVSVATAHARIGAPEKRPTWNTAS